MDQVSSDMSNHALYPFCVQLCSTLLLLITVSSGCEPPGEDPLLLTPYLNRGEARTARDLSRVDPTCLEDFVPPSHTGFLTVDARLGNHLFFWFFPASRNQNAPLLLWLNGGPTVTSMNGLFHEHGPMDVRTSGPWYPGSCFDANAPLYTEREFPWTKNFSMLYVDNPVGTGYSFSDSGERGERITEDGYTGDMVQFLKQFLRLFPEYRTREIYLGGQSYAGKYITALSYELHAERTNKTADAIAFTGIYLGGPWLDPETQDSAFGEYPYSVGFVSHKDLMEIRKVARDFYERANIKTMNATEIDEYESSLMGVYVGGSPYNLVTKRGSPFSALDALMNQTKMKIAAHAGNRPFQAANPDLNKKYRHDTYVSVKAKLAELMNHYKVLIYTGAYDIRVSSAMVEATLVSTPWKGQAEYQDQRRRRWIIDRGERVELAGHFSRVGNFCRVSVRDAGHESPADAPEVALIMMEQFVYDGCVSDRSVEDRSTCPSGGSAFQRDVILIISLIITSMQITCLILSN